ncbi:MAG: efflux RND transporter periplasmic adaptor subunit [Lacunisphaera sp.]|nr:efflux RND transporter periplasmic adaptor subunit [Lacunisphaera sp.]
MTILTKRIIGMVCGVILVVGVIAAWKIIIIRAVIKKMAAVKPTPTVVSSLKAPVETWQRRLHAVGSFAAVQGVTVSNELDGTVASIAFAAGAPVHPGDLLVQLDVSTEQAQLASAEAAADLSRINLQRAQGLRAQNTNSQSDLDAAEALARQTAGSVDIIRTVIAKKTIRAPFAGRLGIRQISLGQFLKAGTAMVSLQALDPLYMNFSLPQQSLVDLKVGQIAQVAVDAYPGTVFAGPINAINSKVDDSNRNVQVQATISNADERIKPGMFASIDVILPQQDNYVTLPQTAISYNPYGNSVYVVEDQGKNPQGQPVLTVRQQFVQLGDRRGDQVAVLKGVKPGEEVVTTGQLKLRNGAAVQINNTVVPESSPAPKLPNT